MSFFDSNINPDDDLLDKDIDGIACFEAMTMKYHELVAVNERTPKRLLLVWLWPRLTNFPRTRVSTSLAERYATQLAKGAFTKFSLYKG
ncbi:hypothetical protein L204_101608 [Cryptococcus depauperatus]